VCIQTQSLLKFHRAETQMCTVDQATIPGRSTFTRTLLASLTSRWVSTFVHVLAYYRLLAFIEPQCAHHINQPHPPSQADRPAQRRTLASLGHALVLGGRSHRGLEGERRAGGSSRTSTFNSVSGLVWNIWYRIPLDQSELSILKLLPTDSPKFRPG